MPNENHANDNPDDELTAMRAIVEAMTPLADFEQSRVLRWACDRHNVTLPAGDGNA